MCNRDRRLIYQSQRTFSKGAAIDGFEPNKLFAPPSIKVRYQERKSGMISMMFASSMRSFLKRLADESCAYP
jgi:hypothetical protein